MKDSIVQVKSRGGNRMDKDTIIKKAAAQFAELSGNTLTEEKAIDPRYVGTVM